MISFTVEGLPQPAGSKTVMPRGRLGFPVTVRSFQHLMSLVNVVDDSDVGGGKTSLWKDTLRWHAKAAMRGSQPLSGPVGMSLEFWMPRPKSHLRKDGTLKPTASLRPIVRPDSSKLTRAVEDALTGFVYLDDAQVVHQIVDRVYGNPRVIITVWPWEE